MKRLLYSLFLLMLSVSCQKKPISNVPESAPSPPPPPQHVHMETKIPTPLAELKDAPLDMAADCRPGAGECSILLLYSDRITTLNWKSGQNQDFLVPHEFFSSTPSRAPSGKIMPVNAELLTRLGIPDSQKTVIQYLVTNNNLSSLLYFDADLKGPFPLDCAKCSIPIAVPGKNTFALRDGKFYDFDFLPENELAVIDEHYQLKIGGKGKLAAADLQSGSTVIAADHYLYTSSPTLPGQPDVLLKFLYNNSEIISQSNRSFDGEILNLLVADLNQDGTNEMIIMLKTSRGIFLEVLEAF